MEKETIYSIPAPLTHSANIQALAVKTLEIFIPLAVLGFIMTINFGMDFIPDVGYFITPIGCAGICLFVGGMATSGTVIIAHLAIEKRQATYFQCQENKQDDRKNLSSYEKITAYLHVGLTEVAKNIHQIPYETNLSPKPVIEKEESSHQIFDLIRSNHFFSIVPPSTTVNREEESSLRDQIKAK